ncbi:MAG: DNA repair protein RecO [Phycisphaeraceae bacterium]|nr:DNA repair protein RecO [Phycisphaeraceae bacterium]
MPPITDDAYVLRHWPYSETSQTAALFTRTHGVLRGLAKGARRDKGPFSGGFETLDLGQIVAIIKPGAELAILTEWSLARRPRSIYQRLLAHHAGLYIADLVRHTLTDADPHPDLWDAMDHAVRGLDSGLDPLEIVLRFQWVTLDETGHRPDLSEPPDPGSEAAVLGYDPAAGRLRPDPGPDHVGAELWRIRVATLGLLRGIDHTRAPEAPGALDDEQALLRANLFLASCLRWVLGRELPTMTALFDQG